MTDINYSQYRMLCKINKVTKINPNSFSKEDYEICEFLCSCKLLAKEEKHFRDSNGKINIFKFEVTEYKITQAGKAQISVYRLSFHKWWIPLIISIVAIISPYLNKLLRLFQSLIQ